MHTTSRTVALSLAALALIASSLDAQNRTRPVRRARHAIANQYIVVLAGNEDPEAVANESAALYRGRIKHVFRRAVRGFALRTTAANAARLANDPRVAYVEEDGVVQADLAESPAPWGLDRIDQRSLPLDNSYSYAAPIRPVRVHVIDTGIRASHYEFGGRAFIAGDFVDDDGDGDPSDVANDDDNPSQQDGADCHGHGTHVAATIGGSTFGVAKQATLLAYRVLDCTGYGSVSSVVAAVDAVTADSYRPAVANMSLTGDVSETLDAAVRRSVASGVTYIVAAGNSAVDASTQSPARVAEAITVGATGTDDARATFSNFGAALDLFAPGVSIQSAWYTSDSGTAILSGTSMAAPHVAGVAALYLEQRPSASPAAVRDAIVDAATVGLVTGAGSGSPNRLLYSGITSTPPPASALPAPWTTADIGSVGATGHAGYSSGTFTVDGAGADIWNGADAFRYVYQPLSGDGSIVARVGSVQNVAAWTKAAVMIRDSLSPSAANATMLISAGKGLSFQRRATAGGSSVATLAPGAAPGWIKLTRAGTSVTAYRSSDGTAWTIVGTATINLGAQVLAGIAVSSHVYGRLATATFTDVTLAAGTGTTEATTPAWQGTDIGSVGVPGGDVADPDGTFTLSGAGADVWGSSDAFHFMYRQVSGDWDIETRVASVEAVHAWTKAGVMIRQTLQPGSPHAFAFVSAGKGIALQYRATSGGASAQAAIIAGTAPYSVKLSRRGSQISAFVKSNGATSWQPLGSASISLGPSVYVGLAITSHDATRAATAAFGSVAVTTQVGQD